MATQGATSGAQHFADPTRLKFYQALAKFLPLDDEQVEERKKLAVYITSSSDKVDEVYKALSKSPIKVTTIFPSGEKKWRVFLPNQDSKAEFIKLKNITHDNISINIMDENFKPEIIFHYRICVPIVISSDSFLDALPPQVLAGLVAVAPVLNNGLYMGVIQVATKVKITGRIQLTPTVAAYYEAVRPNGSRVFPVSTNYKGG